MSRFEGLGGLGIMLLLLLIPCFPVAGLWMWLAPASFWQIFGMILLSIFIYIIIFIIEFLIFLEVTCR